MSRIATIVGFFWHRDLDVGYSICKLVRRAVAPVIK
jgi:hypothetical protein